MKALTSTELYHEVVAQMDAEETPENISAVKAVLVALADVAANEIAEGLPFTIPGIVRVAPMYVAAKPRRKGTNPKTGEEIQLKAQPAKMRVKARPTGVLKAAAPSPNSIVGKRLGKEAAKRTRGAARRNFGVVGARR